MQEMGCSAEDVLKPFLLGLLAFATLVNRAAANAAATYADLAGSNIGLAQGQKGAWHGQHRGQNRASGHHPFHDFFWNARSTHNPQ
jgi:hypothetical protein